MNNDLHIYKTLNMNFTKSIKDYGFMKKYEIVCSILPYVSATKP